ncbi:LuxR C-terminal-related transcriptional regulator [Actinomadura coerulea]|uniref:LuxR C-terminal-related transcriptional regulator n=1 Tax=Actinomadura coerulea TaxID=46159 RepID=UPI00343D3A13
MDPGIGLLASPILAVDLDHAAYWRAELFEESVNRFTELARHGRKVASLRQANGGLRRRSAVFRDCMQPRGLGDELGGVIRFNGRVYGHVSLFRTEHTTPFTERDLDTVDALARPLAQELRAHLLGRLRPDATSSAPGVTTLDASGQVISVSESARDHLQALGDIRGDEVTPSAPPWLETLSLQARAMAHQLAQGPARVRIPTRTGNWLVFHTAPVDAGEPDRGLTVISQSPRPSDLRSLIIDAYRLTPRELPVVEHVAQGMATNEMATRLSVSSHTVRDHLKTMFEISVSTREALAAKLFLVHFEPPAVTGMTHTGSATLSARGIRP